MRILTEITDILETLRGLDADMTDSVESVLEKTSIFLRGLSAYIMTTVTKDVIIKELNDKLKSTELDNIRTSVENLNRKIHYMHYKEYIQMILKEKCDDIPTDRDEIRRIIEQYEDENDADNNEIFIEDYDKYMSYEEEFDSDGLFLTILAIDLRSIFAQSEAWFERVKEDIDKLMSPPSVEDGSLINFC